MKKGCFMAACILSVSLCGCRQTERTGEAVRDMDGRNKIDMSAIAGDSTEAKEPKETTMPVT